MKSILFLFILVFNINAFAQLPPVFTDSGYHQEKDTRARVFLSPKKVLWQSDQSGKYINGTENLLKQGNSQAELVNKDMIIMKSEGD